MLFLMSPRGTIVDKGKAQCKICFRPNLLMYFMNSLNVPAQSAVSMDTNNQSFGKQFLNKTIKQIAVAVILIASISLPTVVHSQLSVDVLVVGGGGGGSARHGGGGGGGQVISTTTSISSSVTVTIGAGGGGGQSDVTPSTSVVAPNTAAYGVNSGGHGGTSSFGVINALGGAGGPAAVSSRAGGNSFGPTNTVYVGGSPSWNPNASTNGYSGGGGAGSGGNGTNSSPNGSTGSNATAGSGGSGISSNITGSSITYGGGGGGGCANNAAAAGSGTGGGGNGGKGAAGSNGAANRGGGGGGSGFNLGANYIAGNGGSGVVVVRYLGTPQATGGTITQLGGYTIHTFTSSGTFAIIPVAFNTQPSSSTQTLCLNSTSTTLVSSAVANMGNTPTYQWYSNSSASTSGATLISGATSATYTPPTNVAGTRYYYVIATNNLGSATSSFSGAIVIVPTSVAGTVSANQTFCAGGTPANITITGSTGSIQWQWSTDNNTFTDINGATSPTLPLGSISNFTSRFYRAIVTSSPCSAATSSVVTVTVIAQATAPTSISGTSSICTGASVTLTAVGGTGSSYQWGTGNTVGNNTIAGQTGATLTVSPTANTTYWVRRTQTSPCSGNTGGVTFSVSISTIPTATAMTSNTTVCPGGNTTLNVTATQVIAAQNFDNLNTLGYSLSAGSISNSNSGNSGIPANSPYGESGSNGYAVSSSTRTITFDNITGLAGFTSKQIEFNLAALSRTATQGLDAGDDVRLLVSTDNGATYSLELEVDGLSNSTWSYVSGTGVAQTTYDGNNTATIFAPSVAGQQTTQGYSTVRLSLPDNMSQVRFQIRMNNDDDEVWTIDDIRVTGIPTFTYSWATVAAPSTVLATTTSTIQSPTSNTTYVATVTNAAGCSATSQVAVGITNPTLASAPSSGNVIWRGATSTDWNTASNWYNFNGTNYSIASAVPTNAIDVIIPSNQTCVIAQPSVLSATTNAAKNVTIESGATLTLAGGTLNVAGDWTNNGTFTGSTGTVSFNGSGAATLGGTSSTTFANLSMDKNGSVSLAVPVTVSGSLALNNGIIELGANNLTLGAATVTGGSATSYVKTASTGTLSRIGGATATTFPVGNSAYNPAVLTNNGTSDVFSVRVIDNVTTNGTGVGATSSLATVKRTWMISEATSGGSNASVRLYWNGTGEEINNFAAASAYVAHYSTTATMWENMGGSPGAGYVQSTDAITNFSPFSISSSNLFAPLPVELLSFDAQCADQDVIVRWTTASEHNSLNFAVQRSEDGTTWADVQTVAAAGNSNTVLDYAIQDLGAARGVKYYRLIQTDQDGVQKIYGPIQTNCGSDALSFLTFPNPSTEEFTILFGSTDIQGDVTLTVSDATGKVVRNAALFIEKGTASMLIPSLDLAPGVYQLQLTGDNFQSAIIKHSLR